MTAQEILIFIGIELIVIVVSVLVTIKINKETDRLYRIKRNMEDKYER